jgi:hypothetical protein
VSDAYTRIFRSVNSRLAELTPEVCREAELGAVRALRWAGPRPPMVRALVHQLRDMTPDESNRDRCHWTLRRLHVAMQRAAMRPEQYQTAANAYIDLQPDVSATWLDADTLLRPWGVR